MGLSQPIADMAPRTGLTAAGLFAGIGGLERGLELAGHETRFLCELDPDALEVLEDRYHGVDLHSDITTLRRLPTVDLIAAGFPCQDLSQAGQMRGIGGAQSGLVDHLFDLVRKARPRPAWILLENVPFMLFLHKGHAMHHVLENLEELGYSWAYRIVDAQAFGLPQRRRRVIILASRTADPRQVLLSEDAGPKKTRRPESAWCGFYWTEGRTGLGWAVNSVPPLKGGSRVGIPSSPAIWIPDSGMIGTPDIRDAERLQGLPSNWTRPLSSTYRDRVRWRMVGNAVSVPVARWLGQRLANPLEYDPSEDIPFERENGWPKAAWGRKGRQFISHASAWPVHAPFRGLSRFLEHPLAPLSIKAASGFYSRAIISGLRFEDGFLTDVKRHIKQSKS